MKRLVILLLFAAPIFAQTPPGGYSSSGGTLGGGSGGGGITSVSSIPATCTPGVTSPIQLSVVPYGIYQCQKTNVWVPAGVGNTRTVIDPRAYGALEDVKFSFGNSATINISNGTTTVQVSNGSFCNGGSVACPAGQLSNVGQVFNATNGCCNNSIASATQGVSVIPVNTTISSVTDSTHIVLSALPTANCTTTCAVAWFTDDTAALDSASTALGALQSCGTVHFVGFSATKHGEFNVQNTVCEKSTAFTDVAGGNWITGEAVNSTGIFPMNEFDATTCTGNNGSFSNVCFLADIAGGRDFAIFGLFNSKSASTDSVHIVAPFNFDSAESQTFTNVAFLDFMGGDVGAGVGTNTNVGFSFTSGGTLTGVWVEGFGSTACSFGGQGGPLYQVMLGGGCGNTKGANLVVSGTLATFGIVLGQTGSTQPVVSENTAGAVWFSHADSIYANPASSGANSAINCVTGTVYLEELLANNNGVSGSNGFAIGAGCIGHSFRSTLQGGATGGSVNVYQSGGQYFDNGDNTYGSLANSVAGAILGGDGTLQGSCSGVATATSTLGLYDLGQNAALTCTSTVVNLGKVMKQAGTLMGISVTATAGGVNASSGAVTLLKNGGATTITCTIGTGTSCRDYAHSQSYAAGDVISVQFTTQGSETLAGVKAVVLRGN